MDIKQRTAGPVRPMPPSPKVSPQKKRLPRLWSVVIAVVVLLILAGLVAYQMLGIGSAVDKSKYQAVFLTNGQVYFGKLSGWGGAQPTLTSVYYFQAANDDSQQPEAAASTQSLIKLGEEIHKPTDKLILNRDSILFVENIEDDGQVVEAIKKNQDNKED